MDVLFSIDPHAAVCLSNWGDAPEDIARDLGDKLWSVEKIRVDVGGIRVTAQAGTIISVSRIKASEGANPPKAGGGPSVSQHARKRMAERGITDSDVEKALGTPRLRGALHRHGGVTVAVGTKRGGETVATAWRG
jgi:hypothetical protein